jgi:serine protease Do
LTKTILAFSALALLALPCWAKSEKSKAVQRALQRSVRVEVMIKGKVVRAASGVVVASDGQSSWILTNEHVVERDGLTGTASFEIVVERPKLHRLAARVIFEGRVPEEDLALLSVEGESLQPVEIASDEQVDVGDDVVVIGAPYGRALSVSSGIVSQLDPSDEEHQMKTDAPIGYGASGGGVFEIPSGKLAGLVEGYRTAKVSFGGISKDDFSFDVPMPGETFLSPPSKIRGFLVRSGVGKMIGLRDTHQAPQPSAARMARAR